MSTILLDPQTGKRQCEECALVYWPDGGRYRPCPNGCATPDDELRPRRRLTEARAAK